VDPHQIGRKAREAPGDPCQSQLGRLVASMDSLRRRLAVGLTYDQYMAEMRGIRSTYETIPIDRVQIECLTAIGTPGEKAYNRYIQAANDWGECASEAGCSSATVEPVLQRHRRIASHWLSEADEALSASAPKTPLPSESAKPATRAGFAWCMQTLAGTATERDKTRLPTKRRCPGWIPPGARTSAAPSGPAPPESHQACESS